PARALASLRTALERAPEHDAAVTELEKLTEERELFDEAAEVLESVYRARGRTDRLSRLYEKRVEHADGVAERSEARRNYARVLEEDALDPRAAQRVIEQGVLESPDDGSMVDELERLAARTCEWKAAGDALASALEHNPELDAELAVELCLRLSEWLRERA